MSKASGTRAVTFDADGTLWDFDKARQLSLRHAFRELRQADPVAASKLSVEMMQEIRDRVAAGQKGRAASLEKVRLESFRQALREAGRPDDTLARHLTQVYLKHRFEDIGLFPDAAPALQWLGTRFTLGIVSNGNSYPDRCGLKGVFSFAVFSQDHGAEKPDPRLFETALERAGCARNQLLHVGDSLDTDVAGAVNAHIKCVWVNRKRMRNDSDVQPDYEISALTELKTILG